MRQGNGNKFPPEQHQPLLMASASVIFTHPGMQILSQLQACRPVIPGIPRFGRESIRLGTRWVVTATRSITVMEYYFYLRAGTCTSHTERWQALSSRYSLLLGCWPSGFSITLILKTSVRHKSRFYRDMAIPARYGAERNKVVYFLRISKVPGVGRGEKYTGRQVTTTTDGN